VSASPGCPPTRTSRRKPKGRNLLNYDSQAISLTGLRRGEVIPSPLGISGPTKQTSVKQARIVPRKGYYIVEVVYEREPVTVPAAGRHPALSAGIDSGLTNLVALTSNKAGFVPRIVHGRPVKSINPCYNTRRAELKHKVGTTGTTDSADGTAHRPSEPAAADRSLPAHGVVSHH
jgi:putative transposase